MKWNLEMIIKECERLSAIKGDTFSIPVSINGRLTTTLGRVVGTLNRKTGVCTVDGMEIAKKLLEVGTDEEIELIIRHEWCHYYLMKTTREDHGHDALFKKLASEMGTHGEASTDIEGYKRKRGTTKYETVCSCCGEITGQYSRAGKTVKQPELYSSTCCKSPINVIQNW